MRSNSHAFLFPVSHIIHPPCSCLADTKSIIFVASCARSTNCTSRKHVYETVLDAKTVATRSAIPHLVTVSFETPFGQTGNRANTLQETKHLQHTGTGMLYSTERLGYGLDTRGIVVRFAAMATLFSNASRPAVETT
jgi:hypothetical protein